MNKCKIQSAMGWECDLEYGHAGDMHASAGDGFYSLANYQEHQRRQKEVGNADYQQTKASDIED